MHVYIRARLEEESAKVINVTYSRLSHSLCSPHGRERDSVCMCVLRTHSARESVPSRVYIYTQTCAYRYTHYVQKRRRREKEREKSRRRGAREYKSPSRWTTARTHTSFFLLWQSSGPVAALSLSHIRPQWCSHTNSTLPRVHVTHRHIASGDIQEKIRRKTLRCIHTHARIREARE